MLNVFNTYSCNAHGHSHLHLSSWRSSVKCHWQAEVLPHPGHYWYPRLHYHGTQSQHSSTICRTVHDHCMFQRHSSNYQCSNCWDSSCRIPRQLRCVPLFVHQLGHADHPQLWILGQWLEDLGLDLHCAWMFAAANCLLLSARYSILASWEEQVHILSQNICVWPYGTLDFLFVALKELNRSLNSLII